MGTAGAGAISSWIGGKGAIKPNGKMALFDAGGAACDCCCNCDAVLDGPWNARLTQDIPIGYSDTWTNPISSSLSGFTSTISTPTTAAAISNKLWIDDPLEAGVAYPIARCPSPYPNPTSGGYVRLITDGYYVSTRQLDTGSGGSPDYPPIARMVYRGTLSDESAQDGNATICGDEIYDIPSTPFLLGTLDGIDREISICYTGNAAFDPGLSATDSYQHAELWSNVNQDFTLASAWAPFPSAPTVPAGDWRFALGSGLSPTYPFRLGVRITATELKVSFYYRFINLSGPGAIIYSMNQTKTISDPAAISETLSGTVTNSTSGVPTITGFSLSFSTASHVPTP